MGVDRPLDLVPMLDRHPARGLGVPPVAGAVGLTDDDDLFTLAGREDIFGRAHHDPAATRDIQLRATLTAVAEDLGRFAVLGKKELAVRNISRRSKDDSGTKILRHNSSIQSPDNLVKVVISISSF